MSASAAGGGQRALWMEAIMRTRPGSVLVVTAQPEIGGALCAALGRLGLATVLAAGATEAIHSLADDAPGAIVVDLAFPDLAPEQLVQRALVCRETHGSPVILLAAPGEMVDRDAWLERGCADVLGSDSDARDIADVVRALARQPR